MSLKQFKSFRNFKLNIFCNYHYKFLAKSSISWPHIACIGKTLNFRISSLKRQPLICKNSYESGFPLQFHYASKLTKNKKKKHLKQLPQKQSKRNA